MSMYPRFFSEVRMLFPLSDTQTKLSLWIYRPDPSREGDTPRIYRSSLSTYEFSLHGGDRAGVASSVMTQLEMRFAFLDF